MVHFVPPTQDEGFANRGTWSRYAFPVGKSIVRVNGVLTLHPYPLSSDLDDLVQGVDYFIGGHEYEVTTEVAAELAAAGF